MKSFIALVEVLSAVPDESYPSLSQPVQFKKEWSKDDFKLIEKAIKRRFTFNQLHTKDGLKSFFSFQDFNLYAGLAYTSSSDYAGYWICNTEIYSQDHKGFKYIGFAISEDNKPYATLWDKDENEIIIEL